MFSRVPHLTRRLQRDSPDIEGTCDEKNEVNF
jgi:hypothetical protein